MKELGSEVARRAEVKQPTQPNPNPNHDGTETPVVCRDASHAQGARQTRSSDDSKSFNVEKRGTTKESMIDSCEIMFFANVCSNMIETKTFVENGTILQNKISPIECQSQNIFDTNKIGGSLSISLETKDH